MCFATAVRNVAAISRAVGHTQPFFSERRTVASRSGTNISTPRDRTPDVTVIEHRDTSR